MSSHDREQFWRTMAGYAEISWYCYIGVAYEQLWSLRQIIKLDPITSSLHWKVAAIIREIFHSFGSLKLMAWVLSTLRATGNNPLFVLFYIILHQSGA